MPQIKSSARIASTPRTRLRLEPVVEAAGATGVTGGVGAAAGPGLAGGGVGAPLGVARGSGGGVVAPAVGAAAVGATGGTGGVGAAVPVVEVVGTVTVWMVMGFLPFCFAGCG